jgi:hypothetical protein
MPNPQSSSEDEGRIHKSPMILKRKEDHDLPDGAPDPIEGPPAHPASSPGGGSPDPIEGPPKRK